jgi:ABC-2 type transport system ATP-binding protein
MAKKMIKAEGLGKRFGRVRAVEDLSFSLERGERIALIGHNGAGKTTVMRLLAQTLMPDVGRIHWPKGWLPETHFLRTGYLPENNPLYPDFSVWEWLEVCASINGLSGKKAKQAMRRWSDACGLEGVLKRNVAHLSKGFQQRLGLAAALLHEPELLLLDEPTTALDPGQSRSMLDILAQWDRGLLCMSTHHLSDLPKIASRILMMHQGNLVFDGSLADFSLVVPSHWQVTFAHPISQPIDELLRTRGFEALPETNGRAFRLTERVFQGPPQEAPLWIQSQLSFGELPSFWLQEMKPAMEEHFLYLSQHQGGT